MCGFLLTSARPLSTRTRVLRDKAKEAVPLHRPVAMVCLLVGSSSSNQVLGPL